jgi:hypothetical protein
MQQNRPLPKHTKAQSWHTQSELVTNVARAQMRRIRATGVYRELGGIAGRKKLPERIDIECHNKRDANPCY